jgi:hypothetical protein
MAWPKLNLCSTDQLLQWMALCHPDQLPTSPAGSPTYGIQLGSVRSGIQPIQPCSQIHYSAGLDWRSAENDHKKARTGCRAFFCLAVKAIAYSAGLNCISNHHSSSDRPSRWRPWWCTACKAGHRAGNYPLRCHHRRLAGLNEIRIRPVSLGSSSSDAHHADHL